MKENTKLGAAVVGGYILGRTKKGLVAARFAMWLSGSPQVLGVARSALSAPEIKAVTDQVRGPLTDAARKAALTAVLGRVGALSNALVQRTDALTSTIEGTATEVTDTATDTVGQVGDTVGQVGEAVKPKRRHRRTRPAEDEGSDEGSTQEPQGSTDEGSDEGSTDEPRDDESFTEVNEEDRNDG